MQLIHYDKPQIPRRLLHQRAIRRAQQHILQHHIIRKQYMRRIVANILPLPSGRLAGVAGKTNLAGAIPRGIFLQRFKLTVNQRVHRVNQNRPDAAPFRRIPHNRIINRQQISKAFP